MPISIRGKLVTVRLKKEIIEILSTLEKAFNLNRSQTIAKLIKEKTK